MFLMIIYIYIYMYIITVTKISICVKLCEKLFRGSNPFFPIFLYIIFNQFLREKVYGRKKNWVKERRLILIVFPCQIARVFNCHSSRFILSQRYVYMGNWQLKSLLTQVIFDFVITLCRECRRCHCETGLLQHEIRHSFPP